MSTKGQPIAPRTSSLSDLKALPRPVYGQAQSLANIALGFRHRHPWGQLSYAAHGVLHVHTRAGRYVVPPQRAVWIPAHTLHQVSCASDTCIRSLYIEQALWPASECRVISVNALLRELILRAVQGPPHADNPLIQQLMLEELAGLENLPLHIPMPTDRRLQNICLALLHTPDHANTLEDWAQQVGASSRTLARLFQQQVQMSFNAWRQQLRLMEALPRLLAGDSVQRVAQDLGYGSARAFSAMFRRLLGDNPRDYLQTLSKLSELV